MAKSKKLTEYDVLKYLADMGREAGIEELHQRLRKSARFGGITERLVRERIKDLEDKGWIEESYKVRKENSEVNAVLACIYWAGLRGQDYNKLMHEKTKKLFEYLFENGRAELQELMEELGMSKPTVNKYLRWLEDAGFVSRMKERPLILKAELTDLSFFYACFWNLDFSSFEERFDIPDLSTNERLHRRLAVIHTYSTTVTEGNTATENQVQKISQNRKVDLTPREVLEIQNTLKALEELDKIVEKEVELKNLLDLHETLMKNLLDSAGELYFRKINVAGSSFNFPHSRQQVMYPLKALITFINSYNGKTEILGCIAHFIFVSIHPFEDGNGRMTRILHSWILQKESRALFAYDPMKSREYFNLIDQGRDEGSDGLFQFLLEEHRSIIADIES